MAKEKKMTIADIEEKYDKAPDRYSTLKTVNDSVLTRARAMASLTSPLAILPEGHTEVDALTYPHQSLGSSLVNALANKLVLSLMPPNANFFKLVIDPQTMPENTEKKAEVEALLVGIEEDIRVMTSDMALNVALHEAMVSLIVGGNALLKVSKDGVRTFRLSDYVLERDIEGNLLEIITKETMSTRTIPEEVFELLTDEELEKVDIYTRAFNVRGTWYYYQTVDDIVIEDSFSTFQDIVDLPFIPLRWRGLPGESYGRGLVEEFVSDWRAFEGYTQIFLEYSEVASRAILGIKPGSVIRANDLLGAKTGSVIKGDLANDVTTLHLNKGADLNTSLQMAQVLEMRLRKAFLDPTSVQRDSERTTATEVVQAMQELEKSLGNVYNSLALSLQKPLASKLMKLRTGKSTDPKIEILIITGIEALGRHADYQKVVEFVRTVQSLGSPELLLSRLNISELIQTIANTIGLDISSIVKSEEEIQQEQEAQAQQQLQQQAGQEAVSVAGNVAQQQLQQQ